jgi:hypothetical protein
MEIVLALDAYDDLFSDFDIRGYGERALSKDFLDELRLRLRRARTKSGLEIVFLVPAELRSDGEEGLIIERLRSFYADRREHYHREDGRAKRRSAAFVAIGIALSVAANFAVGYLGLLPLFSDFVLIPSWFFVWSGFDSMIKGREEMGRKKKYYAALSESRTSFRSLESFRAAGRRRPVSAGRSQAPADLGRA